MSAATDYLEDELLDHVFKLTSFPVPTGPLKLALFTSATTDAAGGTEVSGNGYSRQTITFGTAASGGSISNTGADITFTASGGNWGTITHVAIFDSAATPNMLWHGPLSASKIINDGDSLVFNAGDITCTLD